MVQRGDGASLLLEAPQAIGIAGERCRQNFERDVASEASIASAIAFAHHPRANGREDFVRAEFCAESERHLCSQLYSEGLFTAGLSGSHF